MSCASTFSRHGIAVGAALAVALVCLFVGAGSAQASPVVSAVGVAEVEGVWDGYQWYRYTYTVEWSGFARGLSHLSLLQLPGCALEDHLFLFPMDLGEPFDGQSTGEGWKPGDPVVFSVFYEGTFLRTGGDPSVGPILSPPALPVVKYEAVAGEDEPGKNGVGIFTFICNVYPAYGTLNDFVIVKHGAGADAGNLTGAYPSCTPTPEPVTAALLGLGLGGLMAARRRGRK